MARITVEDCLAKIPNRFILVNMVAKRVRQIREGSEYLVNSPKNEDVVVALREIAAGKITAKKEAPKIEPEPVVEAVVEAPEPAEEAGADAEAEEAAEAAEGDAAAGAEGDEAVAPTEEAEAPEAEKDS